MHKMSSIRKYLFVAKISIQEAAAYRLNHFLSFVVIAVPLAVILLLWDKVYGEHQLLASLTRNEVLTYFILTRWLFELTGPAVWWEITSDIHDGTLSFHLLRPENYQTYHFAAILGSKLPYSTVGLLVILPFVLLLGESFVFPTSWLIWMGFFLSSLLAVVLNYQLTYLFSLTAFWLEEGTAVNILADIVIPFAMGNILPLSFLPPTVEGFLQRLPFQYLLYFPASVYLDQLSQNQITQGVLTQIFWIIILFLLNKSVWKKGLRRFTAVGG